MIIDRTSQNQVSRPEDSSHRYHEEEKASIVDSLPYLHLGPGYKIISYTCDKILLIKMAKLYFFVEL